MKNSSPSPSLSLFFFLYVDLMSGKSHMYLCYVSPRQSHIVVFYCSIQCYFSVCGILNVKIIMVFMLGTRKNSYSTNRMYKS